MSPPVGGIDGSQELRVATNDLGSGFRTPVGLALAVVVRLPAVALAVVVSLRTEHHAPLAADRQGALPQIRERQKLP